MRNWSSKMTAALLCGLLGCICMGGGDWLMIYGDTAHSGGLSWLTAGAAQIAPWRNNLAMALAFPGVVLYGIAALPVAEALVSHFSWLVLVSEVLMLPPYLYWGWLLLRGKGAFPRWMALSNPLVFQRGALYHRICLSVVSIFSIVTIKSLALSMWCLRSGTSGVAGMMMPVDCLLFYLTYLLCGVYLSRFYPDKQTHLPPRYWILFSASTAFSDSMVYLSIEFSMSTPLSAAFSAVLYLVNLGLILLIYYLTYLVSENYARVLRAQAVGQRQQIQIEQFQHTSDMIDRVRQERHELKNTYFYIDGLVKTRRYEELERYLDTELSARMTGMEEFQTGNALVDLLLPQKAGEAR